MWNSFVVTRNLRNLIQFKFLAVPRGELINLWRRHFGRSSDFSLYKKKTMLSRGSKREYKVRIGRKHETVQFWTNQDKASVSFLNLRFDWAPVILLKNLWHISHVCENKLYHIIHSIFHSCIACFEFGMALKTYYQQFVKPDCVLKCFATLAPPVWDKSK